MNNFIVARRHDLDSGDNMAVTQAKIREVLKIGMQIARYVFKCLIIRVFNKCMIIIVLHLVGS